MSPDADGYPTTAETRRLRKLGNEADPRQVIEYLASIWQWPDWGITRAPRRHRDPFMRGRPGARLYRRWDVSTGGWSGNEELIGILERTMFWLLCWRSSKRGGHYVFDVPESDTGRADGSGDPLGLNRGRPVTHPVGSDRE